MSARKCTNDVFIRAWYSSETIAEVSAKTGLSKNSIASRALRLRKGGVTLPYFGHCGRATAMERAAALADKLLNGEDLNG